MKHFWTTAAVAALCAIAVEGWAAPSYFPSGDNGGLLQLVATKKKLRGEKKVTKSKKSTRTAKARRGRKGRPAAAAPRRRSAIVSAAPASVKIRKGETLTAVSRRTGISVEELAKLNRLKKPYHVRVGQTIKLPSRQYYVVKSGDTLYSLARRFGVDAGELAAFNSIGLGEHIRSGQRLYLPGAARDSAEPEEPPERPARPPTYVRPAFPPPALPTQPQPYTPQPAPETPSPGAQPAPPSQGFELAPQRPPATQPTPAPTQPPARQIIPSSPTPSNADIVSAGRGKFMWPAAGQVLSTFGPTVNGQRNDGVNISGAAGDPVNAAADGEVVYAGDQVQGFGNIVLVKHDGGWVTAYAHLSRILVKNRDRVSQGQPIGAIGQTGQVAGPQLHFEIRYAPTSRDKASPVDPMLVLPQR